MNGKKLKWGVIAACLSLFAAGAFYFLTQFGGGHGSAADPVTKITIEEAHADETAYEFEISVSDERFAEKCQKIAEKMESAFEDCAEAEAEVSEANRILLMNFADILGDSYRERMDLHRHLLQKNIRIYRTFLILKMKRG